MYHDMDFEAKPKFVVPFKHTSLRNVLPKNIKYVNYFSVTKNSHKTNLSSKL
jgi:hypothetical protein